MATINLDGAWDFMHTGTGDVHPVKVRQAHVPGPWQAQFSDLRSKAGIGIYRRTFEVPQGFLDEVTVVRFGAVFHSAKVWLNDELVGSNEGGFLPFELDVTARVREGLNEIKVRVESPTDNPLAFPDTPLAEIPFGKQSWYGPLSGIWQSVTLETRKACHIRRLRVRPDLATGEVGVDAALSVLFPARGALRIEIRDAEDLVVASTSVAAEAGTDVVKALLAVPHVKAWSPDDPYLYRVCVALVLDGAVQDAQERSIGFRSITSRNGRLYLNGELLHLRGALDQDYYPDTICTLPSVEFIEDQFRKAKEMGLNCVRCHIKAPDPRYLDAADRIGLLVWAELPNGGLSTSRSRARKEALLKGMVDRDAHHPSIIIWTIINENWGVDLVHDEHHRKWLREIYHWLKAYDPDRLVVDNSPLNPSFHVETDLADYHFYAAHPDSRALWEKFVRELAQRGSFLFSQEGDAVIKGDEPLLCSEFGTWGLPNPALLADEQGREPWWFETGHDWGGGVMYPHGVENRFHDWHLDRVFMSFESFIEATQWHQFNALKYQIEEMRLRPELSGYVITELTDVHWEANGLLDMRRNPRAFHDALRHINNDTVIVARADKASYWSGETARVHISVAHSAGLPICDCKLIARLAGKPVAVIDVPAIEAPDVACLGTLDIPLGVREAGKMARLELSLEVEGREIARGWADLAVAQRRSTVPDARVWSPAPEIRHHLAKLGYVIADAAHNAELVLAVDHDRETARYVREGGRLLLLPADEGSLYPFFPHWQNVCVEARAGTPWQGDWASSFSWADGVGAFSHLPGGPLLGLAFDSVIPELVISGCNVIDFHARVLAGLAVGWIHKPVALAVERGYGKGRVVASTFRLFRDAPGADPIATLLLDGLAQRALADLEAARAQNTLSPALR